MNLPNSFPKPFILSTSTISFGDEFHSLINYMLYKEKVLSCVCFKFAAENSMEYL